MGGMRHYASVVLHRMRSTCLLLFNVKEMFGQISIQKTIYFMTSHLNHVKQFKNENIEVKVMVGNSGTFIEMAVRYMKYCISIYRNTTEAI